MLIALNSLLCADVPLSNYSRSLTTKSQNLLSRSVVLKRDLATAGCLSVCSSHAEIDRRQIGTCSSPAASPETLFFEIDIRTVGPRGRPIAKVSKETGVGNNGEKCRFSTKKIISRK